MTTTDTIKALRDALTDVREMHIGTLMNPLHFNAIPDRIDKALALTADASEDAPDEPVYWLEAEASARGQDPRDVIGKHSMLYSTQMSRTKPTGNNPCWPLYLHPAARQAPTTAAPNTSKNRVETPESRMDTHFHGGAELARPAPVAATPAPDDEAEEDAALIHKLAKMLAEIAVTLKGEEAALHRHSYHDLPELVKVMALELDLYRTIYGTKAPDGWENGVATPNPGAAELIQWIEAGAFGMESLSNRRIMCDHVRRLAAAAPAAPIAEVTDPFPIMSSFIGAIKSATKPAAELAKPEPVEQRSYCAVCDMDVSANCGSPTCGIIAHPVEHAKRAEAADYRAEFERIANAPLKRHSIYVDQYEDTRTQDLWSIWLGRGQQAGAVDGEASDAMLHAGGEVLYGHSRADAVEWAKADKFDSCQDQAGAVYKAMRAASAAQGGSDADHPAA